MLGKEPCAVSAGRQRGPGPQGGGAGWDLACKRRLQAREETSCRRLCRPHRERARGLRGEKVWGDRAACLHASSPEGLKGLRGHTFQKDPERWGVGTSQAALLWECWWHLERNSYQGPNASSVPDTVYKKTKPKPKKSPHDHLVMSL